MYEKWIEGIAMQLNEQDQLCERLLLKFGQTGDHIDGRDYEDEAGAEDDTSVCS